MAAQNQLYHHLLLEFQADEDLSGRILNDITQKISHSAASTSSSVEYFPQNIILVIPFDYLKLAAFHPALVDCFTFRPLEFGIALQAIGAEWIKNELLLPLFRQKNNNRSCSKQMQNNITGTTVEADEEVSQTAELFFKQKGEETNRSSLHDISQKRFIELLHTRDISEKDILQLDIVVLPSLLYFPSILTRPVVLPCGGGFPRLRKLCDGETANNHIFPPAKTPWRKIEGYIVQLAFSFRAAMKYLNHSASNQRQNEVSSLQSGETMQQNFRLLPVENMKMEFSGEVPFIQVEVLNPEALPHVEVGALVSCVGFLLEPDAPSLPPVSKFHPSLSFTMPHLVFLATEITSSSSSFSLRDNKSNNDKNPFSLNGGTNPLRSSMDSPFQETSFLSSAGATSFPMAESNLDPFFEDVSLDEDFAHAKAIWETFLHRSPSIHGGKDDKKNLASAQGILQKLQCSSIPLPWGVITLLAMTSTLFSPDEQLGVHILLHGDVSLQDALLQKINIWGGRAILSGIQDPYLPFWATSLPSNHGNTSSSSMLSGDCVALNAGLLSLCNSLVVFPHLNALKPQDLRVLAEVFQQSTVPLQYPTQLLSNSTLASANCNFSCCLRASTLSFLPSVLPNPMLSVSAKEKGVVEKCDVYLGPPSITDYQQQYQQLQKLLSGSKDDNNAIAEKNEEEGDAAFHRSSSLQFNTETELKDKKSAGGQDDLVMLQLMQLFQHSTSSGNSTTVLKHPQLSKASSHLLQQYYIFARKQVPTAGASLIRTLMKLAGAHAVLCQSKKSQQISFSTATSSSLSSSPPSVVIRLIDSVVAIALVDASLCSQSGTSPLSVQFFELASEEHFSFTDFTEHLSNFLRCSLASS